MKNVRIDELAEYKRKLKELGVINSDEKAKEYRVLLATYHPEMKEVFDKYNLSYE
jgi:hypothetical protein